MLARLLYLSLLLGLLSGCAASPSRLPALGGRFEAGTPLPATTPRFIAVLPIRVAEARVRGFTKAGAPDTTAKTWQRAGRRRQKLGYELQTALAAQLRHGQPVGSRTVLLQDIRETNLRLRQAGITYDNLPQQSVVHLQEVLGVDALLTGQTFIFRIPLSVELTAGVLLNKMGQVPSMLTTTRLTLQDPRSEQPAWQTSFSSSGTDSLIPGHDSELAGKLLQPMPATFPYR